MGAQEDVLVPLQMQLALVRGHVPSRHGPLDVIRPGVADDRVNPVGQATVLHQADCSQLSPSMIALIIHEAPAAL